MSRRRERARRRYVCRVYLVEWNGWREFGIDYRNRRAADCAANAYRKSFPHLRYVVRGGHWGRVSEFVAIA